MPRVTIKSLQELLERANADYEEIKQERDKLRYTNNRMSDQIKKHDDEIKELLSNINWLKTQRDRLIGFIEGSDDKKNVTIPDPTVSSYSPNTSRARMFLDECRAEFVNSSGPTLTTDRLRRY